MSDTGRIKAILRKNQMHEEGCAWYTSPFVGGNPCDCLLSEDPRDMEADPPARVEAMRNNAGEFATHYYDDGRRRYWYRKFGGTWTEGTDW